MVNGIATGFHARASEVGELEKRSEADTGKSQTLSGTATPGRPGCSERSDTQSDSAGAPPPIYLPSRRSLLKFPHPLLPSPSDLSPKRHAMPQEPDYTFHREQLLTERRPGISGFMRIRNGEDWLEASVESHIPFLDEIVAVYNRCTDRTPEILAQLQRKYPDKIKVIEYLPEVYPVGSDLHKSTPADSVNSIANYYNFALAQTTCRVVTKLDDDHVALPHQLATIVQQIQDRDYRLGKDILCFSGINLVQSDGELKAHALTPFAGNGDHWFFEVTPQRYFTKDARFERLKRRGLAIRYCGIAYWHLKYLKKDQGFGNYKLEENPNSRYHKQLARFEAGKDGISLEELERRCHLKEAKRSPLDKLLSQLSGKKRLKRQREATFDAARLQPALQAFADSLRKG